MSTGLQTRLAIVKYLIDPAASRFTVQAFATGLLSAFGHSPHIAINGVEGEIQFVPDTYDAFSLRATAKTSELEVLDEMKREDRKKLEQAMYGQVLEVSRFPEAVYESKKVDVKHVAQDSILAHVAGELSFHGVTMPQDFDARVIDSGDRLRISGAFSLLQSDYGIEPFSFAGGALRLKDELKFAFEFIAKKQV
jgi:polyisoprenoid-binding protein YceI